MGVFPKHGATYTLNGCMHVIATKCNNIAALSSVQDNCGTDLEAKLNFVNWYDQNRSLPGVEHSSVEGWRDSF
jgi:hypothetical protein